MAAMTVLFSKGRMAVKFMAGLKEKMRYLTHAPAFTQKKPAPTLQRTPVFTAACLTYEQGDQDYDGQWNTQQQQEDGTHGRLLV